MSKKSIVLAVVVVLIMTTSLLFKLWSGGGLPADPSAWLLPVVVVAALIDSFNPCAISVFLLTVAFLFSLGKSRGNIALVGLVYIAGIFVTYILIGLGILRVLYLFDTPHLMANIGAAILIAVGVLSVINELFPSFPIKLKLPKVSHGSIARLMEKASVPAVFFLGVVVALFEFPCTGGPYLLILGLLTQQQTYLSGFGYLVLYNLIFVSPLLLMLALASDRTVLDKIVTWKKSENRALRLGGGVAMIILGILIIIIN